MAWTGGGRGDYDGATVSAEGSCSHLVVNQLTGLEFGSLGLLGQPLHLLALIFA